MRSIGRKHPLRRSEEDTAHTTRGAQVSFGLADIDWSALPACLPEAPIRLVAPTEVAARAEYAYFVRCASTFRNVVCGPLVYLGDGWGFVLVQIPDTRAPISSFMRGRPGSGVGRRRREVG